MCGVSRNTVYLWARSGKLKAYRTPGQTNLIRPRDLVDFMQASGMFVPDELSILAEEDKKLGDGVLDGHAPASTALILVVEDEPSIRKLIASKLQAVGPVLQASTGYEALHLLTLNPTLQVVVLDLHMPGQYGLDTLREMKAQRADLVVIVATAYAADIPAEMRADGTIACVMTKPFSPEELLHKVEEYLKPKEATA